MTITKEQLAQVVTGAVKTAVDSVMPIENSLGKYHNLLSKAFVAAVANGLKELLNEKGCEFCFRDWDTNIQKGIKGEWMLDIAVVKKKQLNEKVSYINQIVLALESELAAGSKAFVDDFSKLLVVNASLKVYINGVQAKKEKSKYITARLKTIETILATEKKNDHYLICFVDHPSLWNGADDLLVQIEEFQPAFIV